MYNKCCKPVVFYKLERRCFEDGDINVILTTEKCFKEFQRKCDDYTNYFGIFAFCAPCNNDKVYIKTEESDDLIPLRSAFGGFDIRLNQIRHLCGTCRPVSLTNCYDKGNDHINILDNIRPRCFKKCDCCCNGYDYDEHGSDMFDRDRF